MPPRSRVSITLLIATCLAGLLVAACGATAATASPAPTPAPTATPPTPQRLRLRNAGTTEIKALVVIFQLTGLPIDRVTFGDIAPGVTTDYQTVPHGVLAYAAYSFQMNGRPIDQPVVDFMGAQALPGSAFTYSVDYDPGRYSQNAAIKLLSVTTDHE